MAVFFICRRALFSSQRLFSLYSTLLLANAVLSEFIWLFFHSMTNYFFMDYLELFYLVY